MNTLVVCIFVIVAMLNVDDTVAFYRLLAVAAVFALLDIADAIRAATKARRRERDEATR